MYKSFRTHSDKSVVNSGDYELLSDHPETEVTSRVYRGQLKDGSQVRENLFTNCSSVLYVVESLTINEQQQQTLLISGYLQEHHLAFKT